MIKMKLGQVVEGSQAIGNVMALKLPVKTAYWLSRISRKLTSELAIFNERREALVRQLGTEDPPGTWTVKEVEQIKTYGEKLRELMAIEIEIPFEPVKLEALGEISVSAADLMACDAFIVGD